MIIAWLLLNEFVTVFKLLRCLNMHVHLLQALIILVQTFLCLPLIPPLWAFMRRTMLGVEYEILIEISLFLISRHILRNWHIK